MEVYLVKYSTIKGFEITRIVPISRYVSILLYTRWAAFYQPFTIIDADS